MNTAEIQRWLEQHGCTVYTNVHGADLIGVLGDDVVAVQLVDRLDDGALQALHAHSKWADAVIVAVDDAAAADRIDRFGYGCLAMKHGRVIEHLSPRRQVWHRMDQAASYSRSRGRGRWRRK